MAKTIFEQMGGSYRKVGDYYLPNLRLPADEERPIGIWGQQRLRYMKQHHRALYFSLLTTANIYAHLDYTSKISSAQAMENGLALPSAGNFGSRWEK